MSDVTLPPVLPNRWTFDAVTVQDVIGDESEHRDGCDRPGRSAHPSFIARDARLDQMFPPKYTYTLLTTANSAIKPKMIIGT